MLHKKAEFEAYYNLIDLAMMRSKILRSTRTLFMIGTTASGRNTLSMSFSKQECTTVCSPTLRVRAAWLATV